MGKARKNLGLGLVCLSFLFLFNPVISVVDLLPDFIGYLLLCVGITQLADINYHLEESLRYFRRMLVVSIIQFFSIFFAFGFITDRERPTAILLFTFTFAVIEIIFLSHAYNQFFEGFLYMGSRMDGTAVFHIKESTVRRLEKKHEREEKRLELENRRREKKNLPPLTPKKRRDPKNITTRVERFTVTFVVIKAILTVLPEFSSLTSISYDESTRFTFLYDFINLYRTFAFLVGLPLGLVWLIKITRYVYSIIKDRKFMQALTEKYVTEIEPKTYIFVQRAIKFAFVVMSIGIVFSVDFYIDNNSVLPDFLCSIILFIALFMLRKFVKIPIYSYLACGFYTVVSIVSYITSARFYDLYTLSLTNIRVEAYDLFQRLTFIKIADSLLFFVLILALFPVLSAIIKNYTGFAPATGSNVQMEDKIRYVHSMLTKRVRILLGLSLLCAISGILYILLVKDLTFMWMIDFAICTVFSVATITTLNAICEEVQYKYLLA